MDEQSRAVATVIAALSPEGRAAFVRVYTMLLEFGLRGLAEHPERVEEMVERARRRSASGGDMNRAGLVDGDQVQAGTCVE
jgi:hypothetical protein